MKKFIMMFAPSEVARNLYGCYKDTQTTKRLIYDYLQYYEAAAPILTEYSGEAAAEEAFDLTNNPARDDERQVKYGNGESLSVGDIVKVIDGNKTTMYLCRTLGWLEL